MNKVWVLLLTAVLLCCSAGGCGSRKQESIVTPPSRTGEETYFVKCQLSPYAASIEEACRASDVVAHVKIGNWLGDTGEYPNGDITYFEATAVKTYKGELPETFVLAQEGSSKRTRAGYPLFTYGDELLVFLKPFGPFEEDDMPYWGNAYGDIGAPHTLVDVAYDGENPYFLVRERLFADRTDIPNCRNTNPALCDALLAELTSRDPIFAEAGIRYQKIFAASDMEQLLNGIGG